MSHKSAWQQGGRSAGSSKQQHAWTMAAGQLASCWAHAAPAVPCTVGGWTPRSTHNVRLVSLAAWPVPFIPPGIVLRAVAVFEVVFALDMNNSTGGAGRGRGVVEGEELGRPWEWQAQRAKHGGPPPLQHW